MKELLHQRHDTGYKELLSNHDIFIQLLKSFLKEHWVDNIDETSLTPIDKSFIMPDFSKKEADIVYYVKTKDAKTDIYLYVLLELQSTVDYLMPYRLLMYMTGIWQEHIKNIDKSEIDRKDFRLPPVVPIILYNSSDNWTAARSFKEILAGYELFGKYVLDFQYFLIDVNRCETETLAEMSNIISSVFLVEQNRQNASQLIMLLNRLIPTLKDIPQDHFEIFINWLIQVVVKAFPESLKIQAIDYIKDTYHDKLEVESLISNVTRTIEESLKTSWLEGKSEGISEGESKGRLESKREMAQKLLLIGMNIKQIQEVTGLSELDIISLKNSQQ